MRDVLYSFPNIQKQNIAFRPNFFSCSHHITLNKLRITIQIITSLCPDYVIDLDDEAIYDTRRLPRRSINLQIFKRNDKREVWNVFKQHHYLSEELNFACDMYVAYWNDTLVGMCAVLPQPGVGDFYAYRITRLVILPDFQGLGIAKKFMSDIADLYKYHNRTMFIRTSHIKLIKSLMKDKNWYGNGKLKFSTPNTYCSDDVKEKMLKQNRKTASFKYIASCKNETNKNYHVIYFDKLEYEKSPYKQLNLFDL